MAWLSQGLADMVITDLSRFETMAVLSRQQLDVLLERTGVDGAKPIGLERALDIGRRSQAEALVLGSFAVVGGKVRVEARVHDGRSGHLLGADVAVADSPDQILTQVDVLALKLATRLGVAVGDEARRRRLMDVMTDNLEAYRYYALGLERSRALR